MADWTPDQGGAEGWAQEVACVAYESNDALVLFDPLVDEGDWAEIDALVKSHGGPVVLVTTCPWHARSGGEALRRYGNSPGITAELPGGVKAFLTDEPEGEITLYIEEIHAVVAGDVLIGSEGDRTVPLRVCPQGWLESGSTVAKVKDALRPLLDLEVDAVVPLHGAPVLDDARETLRRALEDGGAPVDSEA